MKSVQIKTEGQVCTASPLGYLGDDWGLYSSVCTANGFRWNKERGQKSANVGSADHLPALAKSFTSKGFSVVMDDASRASLKATAENGATSQVLDAIKHVERMEAAYEKRGLSLWNPFQRDGAVFLASKDRALLGDHMGVGKTVQALTALRDSPAAMVVCPSIAMINWAIETRKWRPSMKVRVFAKNPRLSDVEAMDERGIDLVREARWPNPGEIFIVNYESLPLKPIEADDVADDKIEFVPDLAGTPTDGMVLIGDEIHRCKNRKAKVTRKWSALRDAVFAVHGKVWGLSGTPMFNRPYDLATVLRGLGLFERVFSSWKDFTRRMGGYEGEYGMVWSGKVDPTVPESLKREMLRREKKDVMTNLPPMTVKYVEVAPSKALASIADGLLRTANEDGTWEAMLEIEKGREDLQKPGGLDDEQANKFLDSIETVLKNFSKKIAFEDMSRLHHEMSMVGYKAAEELIQEYEEAEEPLVVFSPHRAPVEALGAREGWTSILGGEDKTENAMRVEGFQAGKYAHIALTIGAGKESITLNRSCNVLATSLSWNPSDNEQAFARVHRGTQDRPCLVTVMVPTHPFVARLMSLLLWKTKMHQAAIGNASVIDSEATRRQEQAREALQALAAVDAGPSREEMAAAAKPASVAVGDLLAMIPEGRYALDSVTEPVHTVFWLLDKPTDGKWADWKFLKIQTGPNKDRYSTIRPDNLATPAAASILQRIAADPMAASIRYGRELGVCGVCGSALTNEESRLAGIGPICAKKFSGRYA